MGGLVVASGSSLDRLKALDSLPDLPAQLEEAKRLCTHRFRAEMILKWALGKLRSDVKWSVDSRFWKVFTSTVRLLSSEQVGNLLIPVGILHLLTTALHEADDVAELLPALDDLLVLLVEISNGANATSVKAALSLPSPEAAKFMGSWLHTVVDSFEATDSSKSNTIPYVQTALQIWARRKPTPDEDQAFAEQCLVPSLRVLSILTSAGGASKISVGKRYRESENSSNIDGSAILEVEIARHVVSSARVAFFQQKEKVEMSGRSVDNRSTSKDPGLEPGKLLQALKNAIASADHDKKKPLPPCIPLFWSIALRCRSMETPKQRTTERPWVEFLWSQLFDMLHAARDIQASHAALCEMLEMARGKTSLSHAALEAVMSSFSGILGDSDWHIDWDLVIEVVKFDATFFANVRQAEALFSKITTAIEGALFAINPSFQDLSLLDMRSGLRNEVVIPIMTAFAKVRDLPTFMDLWEAQLVRAGVLVQYEDQLSIWTQIGAKFSHLIEESLPEDQILRRISRLQTILFAASENSYGEKSRAKLDASLVILDAMFDGIHREALLDEVQPGLENLVELCFPYEPENTLLWGSRRFWSFATTVFRLWWPQQTASQFTAATVTDRGRAILSSTTIQAALDYARTTQQAEDQCKGESAQSARDAECLVSTVCHHLHQDPQLAAPCSAVIEKLFAQLWPTWIEALLQFPELSACLSQDARKQLVQSVLHDSLKKKTPEHAIYALIGMAVSRHQHELIADIVSNATEKMSSKSNDVHRTELLRILGTFPSSLVSRSLREKLLDVISSFDLHDSSIKDEQIEMHLMLMVKILELPNPTSQISTDPSILQGIAKRLDHLAMKITPDQNHRTSFVLFEEVVNLMSKHLLATQEQDRSREILLSFSSNAIRADLDHLVRSSSPHEVTGRLTFVKILMQHLGDGCKPDLLTDLPHRDQKWASTLLPFFTKWFHKTIHALDLNDSFSRDETTRTARVVDAVIQLTASLFRLVERSTDELTTTLRIYVHKQLLLNSNSTGANETTRSALFTCYWNICNPSEKTASKEDLQLAEKILKMQPDPVQHAGIITAFERCISHLEHTSLVNLIEHFIHDEKPPTSSALLLLRPCIQQMEKETHEVTSNSTVKVLPHRLLRIASQTSETLIFTRSMITLQTTLKDKPFLATQHAIEQILIHLPRLARFALDPTAGYTNSCAIFTTLFTTHRARLQGRAHVVVRALQQLLSQLFRSTDYARRDEAQVLTAAHAKLFSRLLSLFCDPPPSMTTTTKDSQWALTDASRQQQQRAGQLVPPLLHQYCTQILHGTLAEGMRDALTPGLWAVVEAMEFGGAEGVKVLSAAMGESERQVLGGVWEGWRRGGRWKGG